MQYEQVRTELNDNIGNTNQGDVHFKNQIEQKVDDLTKRCHTNEKEIKKQYEYMKRQVDIDIGQIVSICQRIENMLEKLESRFQFNPDGTIVAQNLPGEMESQNVMLRRAEHVVNDELP